MYIESPRKRSDPKTQMTSKRTKKWDWRTNSKEMLSWIAEAVVGVRLLGMKLMTTRSIPSQSWGERIPRSDWVGTTTPKGNRGTRATQRPDLARRYFISREQSPGQLLRENQSGRANSRLMHTATTSGMSGSRRETCPTVLTVGCVRVLQR